MSYITDLIRRASGREVHLIENDSHVMTLDGEEPVGDANEPVQAEYLAIDEHYGAKLSMELDRLADNEARLVSEIEQRKRRLAEVRLSQRALNAGLTVLQDAAEMGAAAS